MLEKSFIHFPGIGAKREHELWRMGVIDWKCFLNGLKRGELRGRAYENAESHAIRSIQAVYERNVEFFHESMPSSEMWRLYSEFVNECLFLDIETTGFSPWLHELTLVGCFGRGRFSLFVRGLNLDRFPDYVSRFPLLVTFNGRQFDVPFLKANFPNVNLQRAHIDMRFVCESLGHGGGLKNAVKALGIHRDLIIQHLTSSDAQHLWHGYRNGDQKALEMLVLYNINDVTNLIDLTALAVDTKWRQLGHDVVQRPVSRPFVNTEAYHRSLTREICEFVSEHSAQSHSTSKDPSRESAHPSVPL